MFDGLGLNKLVIQIATLLFAVTIHEVAHGWVAWRLGDPTAKFAGRLTLNPIRHLDAMGSLILPLLLVLLRSPIVFGYAKPVPVNFRNLRRHPRDTVLVSLAGVSANLLCAALCGIGVQILLGLRSLWVSPLLSGFTEDLFLILAYSVVISTVLAVFNLIPIPPLDGSKVVSVLIPRKYAITYGKVERYGMLVLFFLLFTGALNGVISFFLGPALGLFMGDEGMAIFFRYVM